jgi:predicted RNA binding protein YcfA (HicA-like mRNA interferase family)
MKGGGMRRKRRDVEADLRAAGFTRIAGRGKGSHEVWLHEPTGTKVVLPRPKGDLIPDYVDKQVQQAIRESQRS